MREPAQLPGGQEPAEARLAGSDGLIELEEAHCAFAEVKERLFEAGQKPSREDGEVRLMANQRNCGVGIVLGEPLEER